jgi:hypothetical protein
MSTLPSKLYGNDELFEMAEATADLRKSIATSSV